MHENPHIFNSITRCITFVAVDSVLKLCLDLVTYRKVADVVESFEHEGVRWRAHRDSKNNGVR